MNRWLIFFGFCLLLGGCNRSDTPSKEPAPKSADKAAIQDSASPPTAPGAVQLKILDFAGLQRLIASHRGQVVVVDAWSTSCPPCVAEFSASRGSRSQIRGQRLGLCFAKFRLRGHWQAGRRRAARARFSPQARCDVRQRAFLGKARGYVREARFRLGAGSVSSTTGKASSASAWKNRPPARKKSPSTTASKSSCKSCSP